MTGPGDFGTKVGVALVTGGSGGLGRAISLLLASRGSDVAFTYHRNADAAAEVVESIEASGRAAAAWPLELSDAERAARLVADVAGSFGGIHTLVHAAGPTVRQAHLSTVDPRDLRRHTIDEVCGFFNVAQPGLPWLRRTRGAIVAVTTAATRRHPVRDGLSSGPKAAVEGLVRGIAAEEGRYGVRANCVGPGMLTDGMAAGLIASGDLGERALEAARRAIPLGRFGRAEDIAEAVAFLASDRAGFISGQSLLVDGAFSV